MPMIYRRNRGLSPTRDCDDGTRGITSMTLDTNASFFNDSQRWWTGRSVVVASRKVYQILLLAALVYMFLGLPVLGRVLNFARFVHRFPPLKIVQGLVVGLMQDVAIFLQASTCICLVKLLFDSENLTQQGGLAGNNGRNVSSRGFLRDRSGPPRFLPVYMPVLPTEYDLRDENMEALASGVTTNHRTLLSLGTSNRPVLVVRVKRMVHSIVILTLFYLILLLATIASVADFCLQVSMHPRLNRAFVELFFNYAKQFTASLTDEEVMTRTILGSWVIYFVIINLLTIGIYTEHLPLTFNFLQLPTRVWNCFFHRVHTRKDSSVSSSYVSNLFASYWYRSRIKRQQNISSNHQISNSLRCSSSSQVYLKSGPLTLLSRCIIVTLGATVFALVASIFLYTECGVDMKLLNNAMFTLQTEQFFYHTTTIHREELNCTAASQTLLSTLSDFETYEVEKLGNDDHCALLWRKTIGYQGDSIFELNLTRNSTQNEQQNVSNDNVQVQPNIIVINLESWRHLDVGVLGGATKKAKSGKSATPRFDELAKTGVLYTKHYTPCVQTSRTLLTTLFGMIPSCTETTALKEYSTTLNLRGLPHFLKQRGYYNLFWSAVDLTWEYWDKFLVKNEFDKLVDERKIRKMLHETRNYKNSPDDFFSWGMHDHLSFEMLLFAIESAHNTSDNITNIENMNSMDDIDIVTNITKFDVTQVHDKQHDDSIRNTSRLNDTTMKISLSGWEGLREPYFIDMYTITSHNPWRIPKFYTLPDLSELYSPYNKKYLNAMYFTDEMLGDFITSLRTKGLMKNTIIVIQGDHGYGRLEHDNNPSTADSGVWDEASRVPFLLLADDFLRDEDKGKVVTQLTMQSDLMATIADILGVTSEKPLYQHGYGHSMKRHHTFMKVNDDQDIEKKVESLRDEGDQERRVILCNPFNGMSKGVRTEEYKYIFHPDGSYNVFEPFLDSGEKKPLRAGFDIEEMDDDTRDMFDYVTKAVDLNQFLFEANRFMTPLPLNRNFATESQVQNVTTEETVEFKQIRGLPAPVND
ncbi:putative sulfatase, alkaline-phosphatase-like, core domain superfamily [Plasmopara halstedii]